MQVVYENVDKKSLANRPDLIGQIFCHYGIEAFWQAFSERYKKRVEYLRLDSRMVYHNQQHAYQVALNCLEGALYSKLSIKETKQLLVAALYHDADHTLGCNIDLINIRQATAALCYDYFTPACENLFTQEEMQEIYSAVLATKYPYDKKLVPTKSGLIIRDADRMTILLENEQLVVQSLLGLYREGIMKHHEFFDPAYKTYEDFCVGQLNFGNTVQWNTAWAKVKALEKNFVARNKLICSLLNIQRSPRIVDHDKWWRKVPQLRHDITRSIKGN